MTDIIVKDIKNGSEYYYGGSAEVSAEDVSYDNSSSGAVANNIQDAMDEVFQSVSNGKTLIAAAITDKGVSTAASDSFQTMASNIESLTVGGKYTEGSVGDVLLYDTRNSSGSVSNAYMCYGINQENSNNIYYGYIVRDLFSGIAFRYDSVSKKMITTPVTHTNIGGYAKVHNVQLGDDNKVYFYVYRTDHIETVEVMCNYDIETGTFNQGGTLPGNLTDIKIDDINIQSPNQGFAGFTTMQLQNTTAYFTTITKFVSSGNTCTFVVMFSE